MNVGAEGSLCPSAYALDMLDSQGCWLHLKRPQEWSVSLAKTLCLTEELFLEDFGATAMVQRRRTLKDSHHQLSARQSHPESDNFYLVLNGEIIFRLFKDEGSSSLNQQQLLW